MEREVVERGDRKKEGEDEGCERSGKVGREGDSDIKVEGQGREQQEGKQIGKVIRRKRECEQEEEWREEGVK